MSKLLSIGYTVLRVTTHLVNGEEVRSFRDDVERVIVVSDNGSRDDLVERTAEAVDDAFVAAARRAQADCHESAIEVLHALQFRRVPVIPQSGDPRLPFGRPFGE